MGTERVVPALGRGAGGRAGSGRRRPQASHIPWVCDLPGCRKPETPTHQNENEEPSETWGCLSS